MGYHVELNFLSEQTLSQDKGSIAWLKSAIVDAEDEAALRAAEIVGPNSIEYAGLENKFFEDFCSTIYSHVTEKLPADFI